MILAAKHASYRIHVLYFQPSTFVRQQSVSEQSSGDDSLSSKFDTTLQQSKDVKSSAKTMRQNHILSCVSKEPYARLEPYIENVELKQRHELYQPEDTLTHIYFPHDAMISLVSLMEDGSSVEVGMVGFEGLAGLDALLGDEGDRRTQEQMVAQLPGRAARIRTEHVINEFNRCGDFQRWLLSYTRCFLTQVKQTAVCNIRRTLEQRLCRWLLMTHDRVAGDDLFLTQEFMAQMLGVRRAGVTVAAGILQEMEMLQYNRGHIKILDRHALEQAAGECYSETKRELERFLQRGEQRSEIKGQRS